MTESNGRRWADKFCLHRSIFIYIRHIWIKPVLCSCMISLFHRTSPWTHRCLHPSPSAHQNRRVFRHSVQTVCYYWILTMEKVPPIKIYRRMQAIYGDQWADVSTVRCWVRQFKDGELGQADLSDKTRSGRPVTASDQLHQDRVEERIRGNRRIKQKKNYRCIRNF